MFKPSSLALQPPLGATLRWRCWSTRREVGRGCFSEGLGSTQLATVHRHDPAPPGRWEALQWGSGAQMARGVKGRSSQ